MIAEEDVYLIQIDGASFLSFLKSDTKTGSKILMFMVYSLIYKLKEANQDIFYLSCDNRDRFIDSHIQ